MYRDWIEPRLRHGATTADAHPGASHYGHPQRPAGDSGRLKKGIISSLRKIRRAIEFVQIRGRKSREYRS